MKVAIHNRIDSFSERWISYCKKRDIPYIVVSCYDDNIINQLCENNITHFLWHINHSSYLDLKIYAYILNSIEQMGIKTFPNYSTRWHFDDKIAQKYFFESLNTPSAKTHVFYDHKLAEAFLKEAEFPLVAKLRRGAGSSNVVMLSNFKNATKYTNLMFSTGISPVYGILKGAKTKLTILKQLRKPSAIYKKVYSSLKKYYQNVRFFENERNYVLFQEFIPANEYDTRIIVIDNIAFGIRRFNRKNDFRASGSGIIDYNHNNIDIELVKIAFNFSKTINAQCLAYDFLYLNKKPIIIEMSFGFSMLAYDKCEGYWDSNFVFHSENFNPQEKIISSLLNEV